MNETLLQESEAQDSPVVSAETQKRPPLKFCLKCGYMGQTKQYRPGTLSTEVGLWLLFFAPWILNFLWKLAAPNMTVQYSVQRFAAQFPQAVSFFQTLMSRYKAGAFGPVAGLWLALLVPGVLYTFWRLAARHEGCGRCENSRVVGLDSPYAQAHLAKLTPTPGMRSWVCMSCGSQIFTGGRVCPTCGAEQPNADV
jgi:hypothetical protein